MVAAVAVVDGRVGRKTLSARRGVGLDRCPLLLPLGVERENALMSRCGLLDGILLVFWLFRRIV